MPNNHPNEDLHEVKSVTNDKRCELESSEDPLNPSATSGVTSGSNPSQHLDQEEQCTTEVTSPTFGCNLSPHLDEGEKRTTLFTDPSLLHCGDLSVGASKAGNEDINVPLDTTSTGCSRKKQKTSDGCMRKKLLVLDVNGLLVDISSVVPYDYDPDAIISKKAVFKRPYCDDFLKFCFETFNVGVWSSRNKRNVDSVLDFVLGNDKCKLVFCWDQSHCTYTDFNTVENREKPLILKKLKKLWEKCEPDLPWERGEYNESNTLLLDDSPYKAICNPPYTAIFPYTYRFRNRRDNSLGPGGDLRVYLEGLALADNVQDYVRQNPFGQRPITERNLSWRFYLRVIEANSPPPPPPPPPNNSSECENA